MKRCYHLLINSNSGSGRGLAIGQTLIDFLAQSGIDYVAHFTHYAGEEVEITDSLAKRVLLPYVSWEDYEVFPLLVVVGGDGTLHQVLNRLARVNPLIPVGYVPAGSGNDFARATGIERSDPLLAFAQILEKEAPRKVPLVAFKEKEKGYKGVVVNNFGVGLDASVVHATNASSSKTMLNKYKLGSFSYMFSLIRILFLQKPFSVQVTTPKRVSHYQNIFLATTTNHPYFGGGVSIAPDAQVFEEDFEIVLAEKKNFFILLYLIVRLIRGTHLQSRYVHHFVGRELKLRIYSEEYGQTDGETLDKQEFDLDFQSCFHLIWF